MRKIILLKIMFALASLSNNESDVRQFHEYVKE